MTQRRNQPQQEKWLVRNRTNKTLAIGDLLLIPSFKPGQIHDLLKYEEKETISNSRQLRILVKKGWLSFIRQRKDLPSKTITKGDINEAVIEAQVDEIGDINECLENYYTKEEVDELLDEIRDELIDEVTEGEEITDDTGGILVHGKDPDGTAQPAGITGEDNDELKITSIEEKEILEDILKELIKANIYMSIMTGNTVKDKDLL
jgi:hypothetical protein